MDILLGILSVLTDPMTLTDGPVRFWSFLSEIDRSDHCQIFFDSSRSTDQTHFGDWTHFNRFR